MNTMVIDRIQFTLDDRDMTHADLAELLKEQTSAKGAGSGSISRYLRGEISPRLEWVLAVADVLNLDYRWLFSGSRNGWDEMPREEVVVVMVRIAEEAKPLLVFDVPEDWPHLNLRAYIQNIPAKVGLGVVRAKEEESPS